MDIKEAGQHDITIEFNNLLTNGLTNIYYKNGEIGTTSVKASLVKNRIPISLSKCRVVVDIIDSTGKRIVDIANILDIESGIIEILFPQIALSVGISFFELTIIDDIGNTKKSPRLAYKVLEGLNSDVIVDSDKYPILVNLIKDVNVLDVETNSILDKTKLLNDEVATLNNQITQEEATRNSSESIRQSQEATRQSQETTRQVSIAKIVKDSDLKIIEMNDKIKETTNITNANTKKIDDKIIDIQAQLNSKVSNKFVEVDDTLKARTDTKFSEVDTTVNNKLTQIQTQVNTKITEVDVAKNNMTTQVNAKVKEADSKIVNVEGRMKHIENNFDSLVNGTGFASIEYIDKSIEAMQKNALIIFETVEG